ncbi:alpha/beta fold hydrolase [Spongiibacter tropicus]|uniref:alpha/beta fold hydrolase n=1 Tax=Spongiibacter tropicus TaxID=454602 RepID=UPI0003B479FB|nr:alpha/beta hydrolase [Spongiibacter tropicus]
MNLESRFIDAGGITTHYYDVGSGPVMLLIHGGGAGADAYGNWRDCFPILSQHFRVIAPDMVGFGRSDKPSPDTYVYDQPGRNRHISDFIDAMGLDDVILVGNSMGGAAAIGATLIKPERTQRLVLMGSAGLPIPERASPQLMHNLNYDFTVEGMRRVIAGLTAPGYQPPEELVQYRYELTIDPDTKAALAAIVAETRKGTLNFDQALLTTIKQPVLVVNGKDDGVSPVARAVRFLELFDNSWGYIVPHCGHWAMIEHTDDFCDIVLRFAAMELAS